MAFLAFDDGLGGVTNRLLYSEQFENVAWQKVNATIVSNVSQAPDGTGTMDAITEDATTNIHGVRVGYVFQPGESYCQSYFVKPNGRTKCALVFDYGAAGFHQAFFDVPARSITLQVGGGASGGAAGVNFVGRFGGQDVYRIWVAGVAPVGAASGAAEFRLLDASGNQTYLGTGLDMHAWGAQFETAVAVQAGPSAYIPTTSATVTKASLRNDYPNTPASRFSNWTPTTRPFGDSVPTLASGAMVMVRYRTDYGAAFDLVGIPVKALSDSVNYVAIADRLIAHLMGGGTVSVQTGTEPTAIYATCGLAPGTTPSLRLTDNRNLLYTLSAQVINLAASPVRMDAVYAP